MNVEMTLILGMEIETDCVPVYLLTWLDVGGEAIFLSVQEQRIFFVQFKRGPSYYFSLYDCIFE